MYEVLNTHTVLSLLSQHWSNTATTAPSIPTTLLHHSSITATAAPTLLSNGDGGVVGQCCRSNGAVVAVLDQCWGSSDRTACVFQHFIQVLRNLKVIFHISYNGFRGLNCLCALILNWFNIFYECGYIMCLLSLILLYIDVFYRYVVVWLHVCQTILWECRSTFVKVFCVNDKLYCGGGILRDSVLLILINDYLLFLDVII